MENLLEAFYTEVESLPLDFRELRKGEEILIKKFGDRMKELNDESGLQILRLESELIHIHKSAEEGLTPTTVGVKEENGKTIEVPWPDFSLYGQVEYDYIQKRYKETKNLLLKTEYGLMLYLNKRLRRPEERIELCETLLSVAKIYKDNILLHSENWAVYTNPFYSRLIDTLVILHSAGEPLKNELKSFVKLLQDWYLNWPIEHKAFVSVTQFIASTFTDYFQQVKDTIDASKIIAKFDAGINHYKSSEARLASYIGEKALAFNLKYRIKPSSEYDMALAVIHEEDGDMELQRNNPVGASKCYEDAILHYTAAKNVDGINRASKKYEENKGKIKLGTVEVKTNEKESEILTKGINAIINKRSPELVFLCLCGVKILPSASALKDATDKTLKSGSIMNFITLNTIDKFGNTLRVYTTKEDRYIYHLSQHLSLAHQVGVQIIWEIFKRAIKEKIITYEYVKTRLEKTWLAQPIELQAAGDNKNIIPLKTILPGIKNFFVEIEEWLLNKGETPDLTLCSDSLSTKIEMILRYMCKKAGIPTFRHWEQGGFMLSEEKNLTQLLKNIQNQLEEEDVIYIKHLLNEKGGWNLRNRLAHGLLDSEEYSPAVPITLMVIIFRLSLYGVREKTTGE